jgi:hypothetical protein
VASAVEPGEAVGLLEHARASASVLSFYRDQSPLVPDKRTIAARHDCAAPGQEPTCARDVGASGLGSPAAVSVGTVDPYALTEIAAKIGAAELLFESVAKALRVVFILVFGDDGRAARGNVAS